MKKRLSILLILSMLVSMFAGTVSANAASAWGFKTKSGKTIEIGGTFHLEKGEYQDINLFRSGTEVKKSDSRYSVKWISSDPNVVYINSSTGQARADKYGLMKEETGEAVLCAKITNKKTKNTIYRKFNVTVGTESPKVDSLVVQFKDGTDPSETLKIGQTYSLETLTLDAEGNQLSFAQTKLYRAYFCDQDGITISGSTFTPNKEGEYTIIAGAFKSKEESQRATSAENADFTAALTVMVEPDGPQIIDIAQVDLYTVNLTFNKPEFAKAILDNNKLLRVSHNIDGGNPIQTDSHEIEAVEGNENAVSVTMFLGLTEGVTYNFTFVDEKEVTASVTGSGTKPARIKIVSGAVEYDTDYQMQIKVYNNKGVDITSSVFYPVSFSAVDDSNFEYNYTITDDTLYFFKEGATAVVKATLDLGYNIETNRNEVLTDIGQFTSIPKAKPIYGNCTGFAVASFDATPSELTYDSYISNICKDDSGYYLYASFQYTDEKRETSTQYLHHGHNTVNPEASYTYQPANESILMVDSNGLLYPLAKGTTAVYILDADKKTVGTVKVVVSGERELSTFVLTNQNSTQLSATGLQSAVECISMKLDAKDQLGAKVNADYSIQLLDPADSYFDLLFNYSIEGNTLKIWEGHGLTAAVPASNITKRFTIAITADYAGKTLTQRFYILVRNTTNPTVTVPQISVSNPTIDLKLNKESIADYESIIRVISKDNAGYYVKSEDFKWIDSPSKAQTGKDKYSVLILYKNAVADDIKIEQRGDNELVFKAVTTDGGNQILKAATGVYSLKLYKGNGSKAQLVQDQSITLTDSTPQLSIVQKEKLIADTDWDTVKAALSFKRGSVEIPSSLIEITNMKAICVNTTFHISELTVQIKVKELGDEWFSDKDYTEETLQLGIQFKLNTR